MDDQNKTLRQELQRLMRETAEAKVRLDRADGKIKGVPHYTAIELAARELGREVSRLAQEIHMQQVVAEQTQTAPCPECGRRCSVQPKTRSVLSGDGPVELKELVARCPACRRSFFPTTHSAGV